MAGVDAGDTVRVQGTGGVALFALQFARLAGARVIATTSGPDKERRLREIGADEVVDRTAFPDWGPRVRDLTGGHGVDLAVDVGGAGTVEGSLTALALGGTVALVGNLAAGGGVDPGRLLGRGATLRAVTVGSRSDAERMHRVVAAHRLRPVVDRAFPFADAPAAFAHFASGTRFGKVVVVR